MQEAFRPVVETLEEACRTHFGERIHAGYLHGSVDKQDAVYGLSDLDYYLILRDTVAPADMAWARELTRQLQDQYAAVDEVHLTLQAGESVRDDPFTQFVLTYNATLRMGRPVEGGAACFLPDKQTAKWRLAFARQCFADALAGRQPACTGPLPEGTYDRARKLARYFVVVEGAYFLMARGTFAGFGKEQVLPRLLSEMPDFSSALDTAEAALHDAARAGVTHDALLQAIAPLVHRMFEEIERA